MGLLDDAIRQHLDLKRQHGADESELRRKEDEALGPARREAPAADAEPAAEAAPEGPDALDEAPVAEDFADAEEPAGERFASDAAHQPEQPAGPGAVALGRLEEEEPPEEDVLEETPEFLQETPEHDRLWFEQKPPRDFDLDED